MLHCAVAMPVLVEDVLDALSNGIIGSDSGRKLNAQI